MKSFFLFQGIPLRDKIFFGFTLFFALLVSVGNLDAQSCNHQLVKYNLNSCSPGSSYNEFSPNINKPSGIKTLNASVFSNSGSHSCTARGGGKAVCHAIRTECSWADNDDDAFRFEVTIKPESGKEASISQLSFMEAAPLDYLWTNGGYGDNDPPSKYGIRVLKNGHEIFQEINIPTTHNWTTETFDFSNDPDFTVTSQATFKFELLGYCRSNGTSGHALWDVDEIKVFGCSADICDNVTDGGQISGDQSQCGSYNPSMIGNSQSPSGGSGNIEYIWLSSTSGCPTNINQTIPGATSATYNPGTITETTWYVRCSRREGCPDWYAGESNCVKKEVTSNTPGTACDDNNPNTNNDQYLADGCTCEGTVIPCVGNGGDSDGDGVCDNQDCRPNNPNISNPGDACIDGNSNTNNDVIQSDCSCEGTPISSGCSAAYTVDGRKITVTGLNDAVTQVQITNAGWAVVYECDNFQNSTPDCGNMTMWTAPSNGTYNIFIKTYTSGWTNVCNIFETVTLNGPGGNPCDNQGGDSDGDGVCDNQDCRPNNPNISNPGDACNDGNSNTNNDIIQNDCSCAGTPISDPCANQGGDSDGDGVCDNQDCRPNDSNISSPGDACNDGNSNTNNDIIQNDCSCEGTPVGNNSCTAVWAVNGRTISVSDLNNPVEQVQILDSGFNEVFGCNSWSGPDCGSNVSYTAPGNGTYYLFIKSYTAGWSPICNVFETIQIGGNTNPICSVAASVSNIQCQDRGTSNGNDDTYSFDVTATISNGGAWGYTVVGTNVDYQANGSTGTVSGMMISAGTRTFTVIDADDPNCRTTITVNPPAPCSSGSNPCDNQGSDSDGDGVCDNQDCRPNDANISSPGDACNDGNSSTINDVIQNDCSCAGTPVTSGCSAVITSNGLNVSVSGLTAPIVDVRIVDASWQPVSNCNSYGGTPCGTTANLTVPSSGTYYITIKTYSADWQTTYCDIFEVLNLTGGNTGGCDNVTDGGQIAGDESMVGGYDPSLITNVISPSGGSGTIEYIWLSSTSGCPGSLTQKIPGANGATYDPGFITQTTYFRRCSRRAGCTGNNSWFDGESNCIVKTVDTNTNTVCATRNVMNSNSSCGSGQGYGFYAQNFIFGAGGLNTNYDFQNGTFVEYSDNTARLTGTAVNWDDSNVRFAIDVTFAGRTQTPPSGSPKASGCSNHSHVNTGDWYYYTSTTGTATGEGAVAGSEISISRDGEAFQVGVGANLNDAWNFGASGWLLYTINSQPNNNSIQLQNNSRMDFNIRLSGTGAACFGGGYRQQILGLDVELKEGNVDVSWTSNEGFKTDYFEIERSGNGVDWKTINERGAASNDDTPKYYSTGDQQPLIGANFYRVKVIYKDGTLGFSDVKRINISDIEDFGLFPNPVVENVKISLKGYEGKNIEIRLVDRFGKQMKAVKMQDVSDSIYEISLDGVRNGMYHLWIFSEGNRPVGKKVIVNKMY